MENTVSLNYCVYVKWNQKVKHLKWKIPQTNIIYDLFMFKTH